MSKDESKRKETRKILSTNTNNEIERSLDINCHDVETAESYSSGYVSKNFYLKVPVNSKSERLDMSNAKNLLDYLRSELEDFTSGTGQDSVDQLTAFVCCYLRMKVMSSPFFRDMIAEAQDDEGFRKLFSVRKLELTYKDVSKVKTNLPAEIKDSVLVEFLNAHWFNLVTMMVIHFRAKNHHFYEGSEEWYKQKLRAVCRVMPQNFERVNLKFLFREALHPFGVSMFTKECQRRALYLPMPLRIRMSVGPAGTAPFFVSRAVINSAMIVPGLSKIIARYQDDVDTLNEICDEILRHPYAYHVSAGLYGVESLDVDDKVVRRLAPLVLGFVDSQGGESPFRNAKSLEKYRGESATLAEMITQIVEGVVTKASAVVVKKTVEDVASQEDRPRLLPADEGP